MIPADAKPVLHGLKLGTNQDVTITNASRGEFWSDSKCLVYQIDTLRNAQAPDWMKTGVPYFAKDAAREPVTVQQARAPIP